MGVLRFHDDTKEMYLDRYYPGISPLEIQDSTGFPIDTHNAKLLDPPTAQELRVLRQEVDPQRLILKTS
jgi:glutaconate CoA-transferase subunit B